MTNFVSTDQVSDDSIKLVGAEDTTPELSDREVTDIELATGKDALNSDETITRASAKGEVLAGARQRTAESVQRDMAGPQDLEATGALVTASTAKQAAYMSTSEFSYEESAMLSDEQIGEAQFRYQSNYNVASTLLTQAYEDEEEASWWRFGDATLDFIDDLARGMTLGVKEAFEERLQADSQKVMYWAATLDSEAFRTNFDGLLNEYREQGFIRDGNVWGIARLEQALFNEGADPDGNLKKFWAVVDIIDIAGVTKGVMASRKLLTSTTRMGRKTAHEGVEAAQDYAARHINDIDPELQADIGPPALKTHRQPVEAPTGAFSRIKAENELVQRAERILEQSNVTFTPDEATDARTAYKVKLSDELQGTKFTIDSVELNYRDFDAPRLVGTVTSPNGKPFRASKAGDGPGAWAIKAANQLGGRIIPIDSSDLTKGYVVQTTTNVKFTDHIRAIDEADLNYEAFKMATSNATREIAERTGGLGKLTTGTLAVADSVLNGITNSALFRVAGSANARATARSSATIGMADRNLSAIKAKVIDPELKKFSKLPLSDRQVIDDIATDIRDGSFVNNREWLSETEFSAEYTRRTGKEPSQAVLENYHRVTDLWDLVAYTTAKNNLGRFIELDYKSVSVGDWSSAGRKFTHGAIDKDTLVYYAPDQAFMRRADIPSDSVIWSTIDWFKKDGKEAAYVVTQQVDELGLKDVMGYNAGGSRLNPEAKYFLGGTINGEAPHVYLSASTEKQARRALDEVRALQKAVREGNLTDEVLAANSDHLGSRFQTADEFMAFIEKDWKGFEHFEFTSKARDESFVFKDSEVHSGLFGGMSSSEFAQMSTARSDRMLEHFGGNTTNQMSSLTVLENQLGDSLQEMSFRSANLQAAASLVKALRKEYPQALSNVTAPDGDVISQMFQANIPTGKKIGRQLEEQRNIIMRRMGVKGPITKRIQQVGKDTTEMLVDTAGSVAKALGKNEPQRVVDVDIDKLTGKVLGLNHTLAFIAVPFQAFLQGSHVSAIVAASPRSGMRGATMAAKMRGILNSYTGSGERMVAGARLADFLGYTPEQMDEIIDAAWRWGADIIDGENLENGMGHTYGLSVNGMAPHELRVAWDKAKKVGKGAKEAGMMPYNFGERFAQMTSFFTAVDEYIKSGAKAAINSPEAMLKITERANNLNFNMRRTSRSALQQGPLAIPMQFLTYVLRAGEAVLIGRGFTAGERARMAGAMTLLYGATGLGIEKEMDTPESPEQVLLKYGLPDAILSAFGIDSAVAPRMSVVGGFIDMYRRLREDSFLEVLGGPTATLGANGLQAFARVLQSIGGKSFYTLDEELVNMIRAASAGNNTVAAIGIFKHGVLTSRDGASRFSDLGFSHTEAIMKLLGVTTLKETEFWNAKEVMWRDQSDVKKEIKFLSPKFESLAIELRTAYANNDLARVEELEGEMKQLIIRLDFVLPGMGYSKSQVERIRRGVLRPDTPGFQALLDTARQNGVPLTISTLDTD